MTNEKSTQLEERWPRQWLSRRTFIAGAGALLGAVIAPGCSPPRPTEAATTGSASTPSPVSTEHVASTPATSTAPAAEPNESAPAWVHPPLGVGRGLHPGRVVWAHDPAATRWDGGTGMWWQESNIDQDVVDDLLRQALKAQTGQGSSAASWQALFSHFNATRTGADAGYQPGEKIAIKVNLNSVNSHAYRGNGSFTSPHIIAALLRQLVDVAGVPATDITVYDATRTIPDCIVQRCQVPELSGVHLVDWSGGGGREPYRRDPAWPVHWSADVQGNDTYLPTCVTEATYIINLASLKGHNLAGATLCAKNHLGTICADLQGQPTQQAPQGANIHGAIAANDFDQGPGWIWSRRPMASYNALVDLMGHEHLGAKTLLFMLDGLYVAHDQASNVGSGSRWESAPFGGHWTSSILISQDGVAIDSVGLDLLCREPTIATLPDVLPAGSTAETYLHEAAQAGAPPSGTRYDPTGRGTRLVSLGVHEHPVDAGELRYSRNLGADEGIELVRIA